jgi:chemotaxis protein methyltransferase CheR
MSISTTDFQFVTQLVRQRSSIDLQPGKEYLLEARLGPVARQFGEADLAAVVSRLRRGDPGVIDAVIDAMTTNETSWFRDAHPFDAFKQELLPAVTTGAPRQIVIWSAASSSGQEAYSLSILLQEWLAANPGWRASIVGTDISRKMVDRARTAKYSQLEVNRGLPAPVLVRWFEQSGRDWLVKQPVRDLCRFDIGNLAKPAVGVPPCDIVFLRNVLIYFDADTKRQVLANIRKVLRPGGFLVLGGAESSNTMDASFQRVDIGRAVVFRHTGGAA